MQNVIERRPGCPGFAAAAPVQNLCSMSWLKPEQLWYQNRATSGSSVKSQVLDLKTSPIFSPLKRGVSLVLVSCKNLLRQRNYAKDDLPNLNIDFFSLVIGDFYDLREPSFINNMFCPSET